MRRSSRFRYVVLGVICLVYFISFIDRVNLSIVAPMICDDWKLSKIELGLVFSAFAYPYAALQIPGGWLSDKYGPRLVLGVMSVVWGVATLLCGFATGIPALIALRFLLGVGEGGAFPTATRALVYWMPMTERSFAQGLTHSVGRLGAALAAPIVLTIVIGRSWRSSFVVLGVASLAWTVLWLFVFRNAPVEHPRVSPEELREIGIDASQTKSAAKDKTPWLSLIKSMWLVTAVDFCYGWTLWMFLTWFPTYLKEARHVDEHRMVFFATFPLLAGVVGATLGGVLSDLALKKTKNLKWARCSVLSGGLFGALVFLLPGAFAKDLIPAIVLLSLSCLCLELTNAVLWTLPIDIAWKFSGTAGGMMNTGFGVAGTISPAVFGVILQKTGHYEYPFVVTAVLLLIGAVAALFIDPTKRIEGAGRTDPLAAT